MNFKTITRCKENKIDLILFTKLDRWFRNLRHYLNTQEILENTMFLGMLFLNNIMIQLQRMAELSLHK